MNRDDLAFLSEILLADARTILHNQMALADVHADLDKSMMRPFEQDYIYEDHYGNRPSGSQTFEINSVSITSRVLHQTGMGLRDVNGADLVYEIEDKKFVLIQYKRASNGAVKSDREQLVVLLENCPDICRHNKKRPLPKVWLPVKTNSFCGVWYCIINGHGERNYVHGCEAEAVFENKSSVSLKEFNFGMSKATFLEMFSSCRFGALLRYPDDNELKSQYIQSAIENHHLVFEFSQKGQWKMQE